MPSTSHLPNVMTATARDGFAVIFSLLAENPAKRLNTTSEVICERLFPFGVAKSSPRL